MSALPLKCPTPFLSKQSWPPILAPWKRSSYCGELCSYSMILAILSAQSYWIQLALASSSSETRPPRVSTQRSSGKSCTLLRPPIRGYAGTFRDSEAFSRDSYNLKIAPSLGACFELQGRYQNGQWVIKGIAGNVSKAPLNRRCRTSTSHGRYVVEVKYLLRVCQPGSFESQ